MINTRNQEIESKIVNKHTSYQGIYNLQYCNSKWIFGDIVNGEITGFILVKCGCIEFEHIDNEIYFAFVRQKYRRLGILRSMFNKLYSNQKGGFWLEASSNEIENVGHIWEKLGFTYFISINHCHIYISHHNILPYLGRGGDIIKSLPSSSAISS